MQKSCQNHLRPRLLPPRPLDPRPLDPPLPLAANFALSDLAFRIFSGRLRAPWGRFKPRSLPPPRRRALKVLLKRSLFIL